MAKRKIALFGGTFDPIHLGHTTVAADAAQQIGAEKIIFISAKCSPLKTSFPKAGDNDRLKMIALAIANNKKFQSSDYELTRPRPSYTLDTVVHFQAEFSSDTQIHWLMGADGIDDLPRWYKIIELIDTCILSVMYRAGSSVPDFARFEDIWGSARIQKLQRNLIKTPLVDISSTEIRNSLAASRDTGNMLHPPVAEYIRRHGLYR